MQNRIEQIWLDHADLVTRVRGECLRPIGAAARAIIDAIGQGATIFACGNGGSASDAQHFAAELTGRFVSRTRRPLPAIALTTDTSALTAVANDYGFEQVFARQLEALARPGDVLIAISTSGRSPNVLAALDTAHRLGLTGIGLCGADGSAMAATCQHVVAIPHPETARVQEMHITVLHTWCTAVDEEYGG